MRPRSLNELAAFVAVADARSFTKAAAQMGVSPSALSQTIRQLEESVGLPLLSRTTRSVSPTEAGQRLLTTVAPRLEEIRAELAHLGALRDRPAGTVRITASEYAAERVLWPRLVPVLRAYPDINLELSIDHGFRDIAAEGFDAGVRLGEAVEKDMIAVRITPDGRLVAVATPDYFKRHPAPQTPKELMAHRCINLRLVSGGGLYAWEFSKGATELRVKVEGQVIFTSVNACLQAALDGFGIAFLPETAVQPHLVARALQMVLDDWSQPFAGLHLYYPSRRQTSPAFQVIINALRYRGTHPGEGLSA